MKLKQKLRKFFRKKRFSMSDPIRLLESPFPIEEDLMKDTVSFRTSPQTGVGIPRLNVKATGLGLKIFEYQGDCHASVSTGSQ